MPGGVAAAAGRVTAAAAEAGARGAGWAREVVAGWAAAAAAAGWVAGRATLAFRHPGASNPSAGSRWAARSC